MRPARLDGTWALSGWEQGKGAIYGTVTITTAAIVARRVHHDRDVSGRAQRRDRDPHRPRNCLYRFPVARPIVDAGGGLGDARSDDGRSQLAVDGGTLVHRWIRRARHRREARARRRGDARARHRSDGAQAGRCRPAAENLRRQSRDAAGARYRSRPGPDRHAASWRPHPTCSPSPWMWLQARLPARATCSWVARRARRRSRFTTRSTASRSSLTGRWRASAAIRSRRCSRNLKHGPTAMAPTASRIRPTTSISGMVDASWSMEEYAATYNDDDIKFVGTLERGHGPVHAECRRPESPARRIAQQHRRCLGGREVSRRCRGREAGADAEGTCASTGHGAALHGLRSIENAMNVGLREFHSFEAAGRRFLYLVPSAAVFALDDCSSAILDSLSAGPRAGR